MSCFAYNKISSVTYEIDNIGNGDGIFAQNSTSGNVITFELKSITAGNNINLVANNDTIEILADSATINNVGGGAEIGQNVTGNTINFRTLIGNNNITLAQNTNDITISSEIIQSANNTTMYNYGEVTSINLAASYNSPSPVISNIGAMDHDSGQIIQTSLTTVDYYPAPRNKKAAFFYIYNNIKYWCN